MNTPIFTRRILILASAISLGGALSADAGQIMADTTSRTRIAAEVDANPTMTMTADTVRRAASTASATARTGQTAVLTTGKKARARALASARFGRKRLQDAQGALIRLSPGSGPAARAEIALSAKARTNASVEKSDATGMAADVDGTGAIGVNF
ncbi:hypothetical protein [Thiosulfatihalobacter marinus]|uniref:hypothetical protein n=1 Tax=Thiosulfatihalobacter marinus TaxID=2792481 RepID=UPI0018DA2E0C|nr:hypothetical protein [Thiosulfatihalobacter marinus]